MQKNSLPRIFAITALLFLLPLVSQAQLPQSNLIYINLAAPTNLTTSDSLFNYDPSLPVSATNPYLNTIVLPTNNCGLAVSPVLGSSDTTQTFYTTVNGTFWYYDHNTGSWVNTGHSIGDPASVNIGAGGGYVYSFQAQGFYPSVYKYDGTGDATFVAGGMVFPLPYDLLVDCSGNFYVMGGAIGFWSIAEYSPSGTVVQGYTVNNPNNWAGSGGFANIGRDIYYDKAGSDCLVHATASGSTVTVVDTTGDIPFLANHNLADMANVANSLSDILPFVSISTNDTIICPGDTAVFNSSVVNAGTGSQYQWFVNSIPQLGAITGTFTYQPADGDTVSLHYTSGASCGNVTAISPGVVIHVGMPVTTIDYGAGPFCKSAGSISPVLTGAQGGSYTAPAGLSINAGSGVINTITSTPGTYVVTYTVSGNCGNAAATDTVTINAVDLNISAALPVPASRCNACDGKIVLHGLMPGQTDTVSYSFNGVQQSHVITAVGADSIITLVNLCAGTYSNIKVSAGGCASLPVTAVVTGPSLQAGFTYAVHFGCGSDTVVFNNTSLSSATPTYIWQFGDQTADTATNPVHVYMTQGNYNVQLQVNTIGCSDSTSQSIALMHPVFAGFTNDPDTICQGRSVNFTNTSVGTSPAYVWDFGDGVTDTAANPSHQFDHAGTFNVKLVERDFIPCYDSVSRLVIVDSVSPVDFTVSANTLCQGQGAIFTNNSFVQNGGASYWDFGDNTIIKGRNPVSHAYDNPGNYTVSFTASFGACPDTTFSRNISVSPYPVINIGKDTSMCPGAPPFRLVDTANTGNTAARWIWNTGDTTSSIMAADPGNYYATVTLNGCSNTDSILIRNDCYIGLPNVFTPNGDGVNDYFFPRQYLSASLTAFKMTIYNRWGQIVFETNSINGRGWDGKFNDEPQPAGVFIYVIDADFENGSHEHHNGNVTLLR